MKILGISGSPRAGGVTAQLVQAVLAACPCDTEFISLAGKRIEPCAACLGCADTNVCVIRDDMSAMRAKLVEADGYVIGAANYFRTLNALTHCFMERFFQFRHREVHTLGGKPVVAVAAGGRNGDPAIESLKNFFRSNHLECIGSISAQGVFRCFECGYGEDCKAGGFVSVFGNGTKICEETTPTLIKQPDVLQQARELGVALSKRGENFTR